MQNLKIPAIIFTALFLFSCGPSEEEVRLEKEAAAEEVRLQKEASVISQWNNALDQFKGYQEDEDLVYITEGVGEFYMTSDGRGIVFRESQYEMIGFIAFNVLTLGIPDYIREQIANTAPIDGNQKARYDNVEINWSVDRTTSYSVSTIKIYLSLRLID